MCRTLDVSEAGLSLDTIARLTPGTRVTIALRDVSRGISVDMAGEVVRAGTKSKPSIAISLHDPPVEWQHLVTDLALVGARPATSRARRLRVLVVGDEHRQRGAMALYQTSGWDVVFAPETDTVDEALAGGTFDAVIAEHDADDPRWKSVLEECRRIHPRARRLVRGRPSKDVDAFLAEGLVHRFVDRDAGVEALLDALTANIR